MANRDTPKSNTAALIGLLLGVAAILLLIALLRKLAKEAGPSPDDLLSAESAKAVDRGAAQSPFNPVHFGLLFFSLAMVIWAVGKLSVLAEIVAGLSMLISLGCLMSVVPNRLTDYLVGWLHRTLPTPARTAAMLVFTIGWIAALTSMPHEGIRFWMSISIGLVWLCIPIFLGSQSLSTRFGHRASLLLACLFAIPAIWYLAEGTYVSGTVLFVIAFVTLISSLLPFKLRGESEW